MIRMTPGALALILW